MTSMLIILPSERQLLAYSVEKLIVGSVIVVAMLSMRAF